MVPFDADPIGMSAVNDTFPRAGADGSFSNEKTVSLKALEAAFTKKCTRPAVGSRSACGLPARNPGINEASRDGRFA